MKENLKNGVPSAPKEAITSVAQGDKYPAIIQIDGPKEDQDAINSWIAKLQLAFDQSKSGVPSPFLGHNDPYKGHIFWDADVWLFPALALLDPRRATNVPDLRLEWRTEYTAGTLFWEVNQMNMGVVVPTAKLHRSQVGSAWWMLQRANALGLVNKTWKFDFEVFPKEATDFYKGISIKTKRGYEIHGVKSIDEYGEKVDNDLYTNLVARNATGLPYYLPHDSKSLLTYDGDRNRTYQQAAAVLAIFPLQAPEAENQAQVMMDRFARKVNKRGPAMSDSIHATIYARLGQREKAYETWQKSWRDFQPDLETFNEYRNQKRSYFITGAAGCLNTVLYGFAGFRIDSKKLPGASWTKQLDGGYWLSIKPQLPPKWRSITVPFTVLGKKYTLVATHAKVSVN